MEQPNQHKNAILEILSAHSRDLTRFGVLEIGLFGSYARGKMHGGSDIDILVDIEKEKKTFRNFMALCYYLEELLGKKVDLVTRQSLSPYIGLHILKTIQYASLAD
jgi:predicted nucleotidyltransferase